MSLQSASDMIESPLSPRSNEARKIESPAYALPSSHAAMIRALEPFSQITVRRRVEEAIYSRSGVMKLPPLADSAYGRLRHLMSSSRLDVGVGMPPGLPVFARKSLGVWK